MRKISFINLVVSLSFLGAGIARAETCQSRVQKVIAAGVPYDLLDTLATVSGKAQVSSGDQIYIVDYSKPSTEKRFFSIDTQSGNVESFHVSHGAGSGKGERTEKLSNDASSLASPQGLFTIEMIKKTPKQGDVSPVNGIEEQNKTAHNRGINVQGCAMVQEKDGAKAGTSAGSFCLSPEVYQKIKPALFGCLLYSGKSKLGGKAPAHVKPTLQLCSVFGFTGHEEELEAIGKGRKAE